MNRLVYGSVFIRQWFFFFATAILLFDVLHLRTTSRPRDIYKYIFMYFYIYITIAFQLDSPEIYSLKRATKCFDSLQKFF